MVAGSKRAGGLSQAQGPLNIQQWNWDGSKRKKVLYIEKQNDKMIEKRRHKQKETIEENMRRKQKNVTNWEQAYDKKETETKREERKPEPDTCTSGLGSAICMLTTQP